ncbi:MAG: hypothetical protein Q8L86_10010 [Vicinamibacterales bacterium]|nr:hypothetical protein [Vicinamibacterales bacterium]
MRFPALSSRLSALVLCVVLAAGCGLTLPEVIVVPSPPSHLPPPTPPTPVEPEAPRVWSLVVAAEPGARIWAYERDPATPASDVQAPADGPMGGTVTVTLPEAGYTVCASLAGYYDHCAGVHLTAERDGTRLDLALEAIPAPPPVPAPPAPRPEPPMTPAPTPVRPLDPPPGGRLHLPAMRSVVEAVARERQDLLARSCQEHGGTWEFLDLVVDRLRASDLRWGYNWKRGVVGDPSLDVVAYHYGPGPSEGSPEVYIIDIIAGHCGPSPSAAWIDQTEITRQAGAIGRWTSRGRW